MSGPYWFSYGSLDYPHHGESMETLTAPDDAAAISAAGQITAARAKQGFTATRDGYGMGSVGKGPAAPEPGPKRPDPLCIEWLGLWSHTDGELTWQPAE